MLGDVYDRNSAADIGKFCLPLPGEHEIPSTLVHVEMDLDVVVESFHECWKEYIYGKVYDIRYIEVCG